MNKISMCGCALMMTAGMAFGQCDTAKACEGEMMETTASMGVFESMDDIIEVASGNENFSTLVAAIKAADLVEALRGDGPFTVFAPTNDAFAKLPKGTVETLLKPENKKTLQAVLMYHVVPGRAFAEDVVGQKTWATLGGQRVDIKVAGKNVKIDGAKITATDLETSNGVIHVIDSVIMPETKSIPEVAAAAGSFGTLLAAIEAAGLSETLMGEGPFTVLAPTDEAFAALGDTVGELLKPENRAKLAGILTYHVLSGRVYADQVVTLDSAPTVEGSSVSISTKGNSVYLDEAKVIKADIEASNGVIHVINKVILPG
ncbi:MAG: transforming growth factor-beta-induced protein [Phycisphaerales bacterium]|jgi:transforming growth factor-beta-induced protein